MTLEEAIDCLGEEASSVVGEDVVYRIKAIRQGIEALKYRKHLVDEGIVIPGNLLPGETEK